jgi:hypothetical protein
MNRVKEHKGVAVHQEDCPQYKADKAGHQIRVGKTLLVVSLQCPNIIKAAPFSEQQLWAACLANLYQQLVVLINIQEEVSVEL